MCINVHALFLPDMAYDRYTNILDQLDDGAFRMFKRYLQEPSMLDGEKPVGRALLEKRDRGETADVIVENYPDVGDQIVAKVLSKIGRKDLLKSYLKLGR